MISGGNIGPFRIESYAVNKWHNNERRMITPNCHLPINRDMSPDHPRALAIYAGDHRRWRPPLRRHRKWVFLDLMLRWSFSTSWVKQYNLFIVTWGLRPNFLALDMVSWDVGCGLLPLFMCKQRSCTLILKVYSHSAATAPEAAAGTQRFNLRMAASFHCKILGVTMRGRKRDKERLHGSGSSYAKVQSAELLDGERIVFAFAQNYRKTYDDRGKTYSKTVSQAHDRWPITATSIIPLYRCDDMVALHPSWP